MLLIDALVGWLVGLGGDALLRRIRGSPDERALRNAMALAIEHVIDQTLPESHEALESALCVCFSAPLRLSCKLDDSTLERDLIAATAAQMEPVAELVEGDLKQGTFYESTGVELDWLVEEVTSSFITALRQVVAMSGVTELVHRLDADEVNARLHRIESKLQAASSSSTRVSTMFTLPRDTSNFVGRYEELETVLRTAVIDEATSSILAIDGMAGVGKTALAIHAAHRLAPLFPDGQLFVSLHGYAIGQRAVEPADALSVLLQAAGMDGRQIPVGVDAMSAMWRALLRDKRVLILLDDATSHEQIQPLMPGASGCMVLITSRRRLAALEDVFTVSLNTMPPEQASAFFKHIAQRTNINDDDKTVRRIVDLCGHLPLAIRLLAGLLRNHSSWSTEDLLSDLDSARQRVTAVRAENMSVSATLDVSYARLPDDEKSLLRILGLHVGPEIDPYGAAALANADVVVTRDSLIELYNDHMIDELAPNRFRLHDLIREYAQSLTAVTGTSEREAAFGRLLDYYLCTASAATRHIARRASRREYRTSYRPTGIPEISNRVEAIAWLESELTNLQMYIINAPGLNKPLDGARLAEIIAEFLLINGHWAQALTIHQAAVEAARMTSDQLTLALALNNLGSVQRFVENYVSAERSLTEALHIFGEVHDESGEAEALHHLAIVQRFRSDYSGARNSHERALNLFRHLNDDLGQAKTLEHLGVVQRLAADYEAATASLSQALNIFRALGDQLGEADTLHDLAAVQRLTGRYNAAVASHQRALDIYRDLNYSYGQAYGLTEFAIVLRITGEREAAEKCLVQALKLFESLGDHLGEADVIHGLGAICQLKGDYSAAITKHEQSLAMYRELDYRYGQAYALRSLGVAVQEVGDYEKASDCLGQAVTLFHALNDQHGEIGALNSLGISQRLAGSYGESLSHHQIALDIARQIGVPLEEARAIEGIGFALTLNGQHLDGIDFMREALSIYERLEVSDAERVRTIIDASRYGELHSCWAFGTSTLAGISTSSSLRRLGLKTGIRSSA